MGIEIRHFQETEAVLKELNVKKLAANSKETDANVIEEFLLAHVPELMSRGEALVTPPLTFDEVVRFVTAVSTVVQHGLAILPGADRLQIVKGIVRHVAKTYLRGKAKLLDLFLSDSTLDALIEFVYRFSVKPSSKGQTSA